jgi:hypothetical protein
MKSTLGLVFFIDVLGNLPGQISSAGANFNRFEEDEANDILNETLPDYKTKTSGVFMRKSLPKTEK